MAWYNASWAYRKKITVLPTYLDAAINNEPIRVDLSSDVDIQANAKGDYGDVRVTLSDEVTEVPIKISGNALWFDCDTMPISGDEYYLYYGNPSANLYLAGDPYGMNALLSSAGYECWYDFQEVFSGAGSIIDSTSNNRHMTPVGITPSEQVSGSIDENMMDLSALGGTTDYGASMGTSASNGINFASGPPFVINAWFYLPLSQVNKGQILYSSFDNVSGKRGPFLLLYDNTTAQSTGAFRFQSRNSSQFSVSTYSNTLNLTTIADQWNLLTVSMDASGNVSFQLNGAAFGTDTHNVTYFYNNTADCRVACLEYAQTWNSRIRHDLFSIKYDTQAVAINKMMYNNLINYGTFLTLGPEETQVTLPTAPSMIDSANPSGFGDFDPVGVGATANYWWQSSLPAGSHEVDDTVDGLVSDNAPGAFTLTNNPNNTTENYISGRADDIISVGSGISVFNSGWRIIDDSGTSDDGRVFMRDNINLDMSAVVASVTYPVVIEGEFVADGLLSGETVTNEDIEVYMGGSVSVSGTDKPGGASPQVATITGGTQIGSTITSAAYTVLLNLNLPSLGTYYIRRVVTTSGGLELTSITAVVLKAIA